MSLEIIRDPADTPLLTEKKIIILKWFEHTHILGSIEELSLQFLNEIKTANYN